MKTERVNCIFWPEALLSLVALSCSQVLLCFLRLQLGLGKRRKSSSCKFLTVFIKMDNCFYKRDNCAHPVSFNYEERKNKSIALCNKRNVDSTSFKGTNYINEQIVDTDKF